MSTNRRITRRAVLRVTASTALAAPIVINAKAGLWLDAMSNNGMYGFILANDRGGYLRHPDPALNWQFEFGDFPGCDQSHPLCRQKGAGHQQGIHRETLGDHVFVMRKIPLGSDPQHFLVMALKADQRQLFAETRLLGKQLAADKWASKCGTCSQAEHKRDPQCGRIQLG